jgi:hypothetical protein
MKKTLLITLLLIPFLGISQTTKPIEGFLGIKFGSNKATVIAAIKERGGILNNDPSGSYLNFSDVSLGHRKSTQLQVKFFNDKLYFGGFVFQPENDPQTFVYYNNLVNDITELYGKGSAVRNFKSPYKDGDGDEIMAVRSGYGNIYNFWSVDKKRIDLSINTKLKVILIYMDDVLDAEANAAAKAKEKSDF